MPLWKIEGAQLKKFEVTDFALKNYEQHLEEWLESNSDVIFDGQPLLWIGRQVHTEYGTIADLIGLDASGNAVVVELKRDMTPRDIVAQALEYAAWVRKLEPAELAGIASNYFTKQDPTNATPLKEKFSDFFGDQDPPPFNRTQRVVLIGQVIDPRVLDVVAFLRGYGLDISCLQFTYHETEAGEKLLLTEMTVGGDDPGEIVRAQTDSSQRQRNRLVVKRLSAALNERFADRLHTPFLVYQERTGPLGDTHTTFETDSFRMGLDFIVDGLEARVHIHSRKKTTQAALADWVASSGLLSEFENTELTPSKAGVARIYLSIPSDASWEHCLREEAFRVTEAVLMRIP